MRRRYKSRNGCLRCKKRRVKCDEKRPCTACVKHDISCSLGMSVSSASPPTGPSSVSDIESSFSEGPVQNRGPTDAPPALRPSRGATPLLPNPASALRRPTVSTNNDSDARQRSPWITDLELMHHWCTVTCFTLPRGDELCRIWQVECVQLAFMDEPFMHQILAISAFHMACLQPSHRQSYRMLASQHHGHALQGLRTKFTHEVTPESSHSTFAAAALLVIGAFAAFAVDGEYEEDTSPGLKDMLDMFGLMRGMNMVLETWNHTLVRGRFADMFIDQESSRPMVFLEATCEKLRNLGESLDDDERRPVIGHEIITFIDCVKQSIPTRCPEIRLAILWPIRAHPDFLLLLQQKNEEALTILAYYCAIVHEAQSYAWYCRRWGPNIARDIKNLISSPKAEAVAWPLAYMSLS